MFVSNGVYQDDGLCPRPVSDTGGSAVRVCARVCVRAFVHKYQHSYCPR